jgi:hypothetical protein
MFNPNLDLQVVKRCSSFRIYDKTGVDTGDGDKWDGVAGLDSSTLTSAIIRIVYTDDSYTDVDVLSQIPSPVTGEFTFADTDGVYIDGLYNLVYKLKTVDFAVSAYTDYSATVDGTTKVTATGHGLTTGLYSSITGTTNYNGDYYATRLDADEFYIAIDYVADDGVSTGTTMYQSTFYPYAYCRAEAGVDALFAQISRMTPGPEQDQYRKDAQTAEGLLMSLKSAITSSNVTALDNQLARINQILDFRGIEVNF